MATDGPRERLLHSAVTLMCDRGVHATGLADLLAHSHTARASLYHHFPGGKIELMTEATRSAGAVITDLLDRLSAGRDPAESVDAIVGYWKYRLVDSDYRRGCPILAASQAGPEATAVRDAAAEVFAAWVEKISATLAGPGFTLATARSVASTIVSSVEGAIARSRSARSTAPLDDVAGSLRTMLDRHGAAV